MSSKKTSSKNTIIPGVPETGPGSAKVGKVRRPPAPSGRQRPHRVREAHEQLVEHARRERARCGLAPDEIACERIARRQLDRLVRSRRSPQHGVGHKIGPSDRRTFRQDLLHVKALRESEIGQELREQLGRFIGGRPSDHAGAIAIQELLLWSSHPWTVRSAYALLEQGRNDWPSYTLGENCHDLASWAATYDAIGGALRRDGHGRRQGLTDRIDANFFDKALAQTARKLAAYAGEGADRALSIDGTLMRICVPQRQSFSQRDEERLNGDFGSGFGTHGKQYVRGYNVMALVATSITAPIAVTVEKANLGERGHTLKLLEMVYRYWPDLAPEYLVGDRNFDVDWRLYRDLSMRFGINLVAPRKGEKQIPKHLQGAFAMGVPVCACSGTPKMMRMHSADGFPTPQKRRELGLRPGEDAEQLLRQLGHRMRVRYRCGEPGCESKGVDLDPRTDYDGEQPNWRFATRLPHQPIHRSYSLREELLAARNGSESVWNAMKLCGIDSSGAMVSRWQNTQAQQEATIKAKALRHSLLKLMERDGTLERIYAEAEAEGYIRTRRRK